jgi:hypothetical protein
MVTNEQQIQAWNPLVNEALVSSSALRSHASLPIETLRQRSPHYRAEEFAKRSALFHGGDRLQPFLSTFLPKNIGEMDGTYRTRTANAQVAYENNLAAIIAHKDNQLFAYPFGIRPMKLDGSPIESAPYYEELIEDATSRGTSLMDFVRARFVEALIDGKAHWILRKPLANPKNLLEYESAGAGNVELVALDSRCLIDHQEEDGVLQWATVHECESIRPSPLSQQILMRETWTVYDTETVSTYQITYKPNEPPKEKSLIPLISSVQHGFLVVPIITLRLPRQLTVVPLVGDLQILHFQMSFALSWAMKRFCYPIGVLMSDDAEQRNAQQGHFLTIGSDDKFAFESPDPSGFEAQSSHIRSIKDEIFRICAESNQAQDMHLNGSVSRSADSKQIDTAVSEQSLNRCGAIVREAVQTTLEYIAAARGEAIKFDVSGLDRFAIALQGNSLQDVLQGIQELSSSPDAVLELRAQLVQKLLHDIPQETKQRIRAQLESSEPNQVATAGRSIRSNPIPTSPLAPIDTPTKKQGNTSTSSQ